MYSKIEENDMTQTSFSMNTILTTEKTKVHSNESEEEITQQQQQQKTNEEIKKKIEDEQPKKEELSSEAKHVHNCDIRRIRIVTLDESELWKKFKTLTNEMIVSKNGRYDFIGSQRKW